MMVSGLARNGGLKQEFLSAIRQKISQNKTCKLSPAEAVLVLEWAIECDDHANKAELLQIFDVMGGLTLVRDAMSDHL